MFTIPCPDEVFISTELSSGFGRRLPCYNTDQCVIMVKEESAPDIAKITHDPVENSSQPKAREHVQNSPHSSYKSSGEHKWTLEELKKKSPPGYKKFEAALGSQDLDEKTALQLWEDIFKPLSSFELLKIGTNN